MLFKPAEENDFCCTGYTEQSDFFTDERAFVPTNQTRQLSLGEVNLLIYDTLNETQASNSTLAQAGTTQFDKDILANFNDLFWHGGKQTPSYAEDITNGQNLKTKIDTLKKELALSTENLAKDDVIKLIKRYPLIIKFLDEKWQNDHNILMNVLPFDPNVLQVAGNKTLLAMIKDLPFDKTYLAYASPAAKDNEEVVIAFLNHNEFNFDYCSKKMRSNPNVMLVAIAKNSMFFPSASDDLKNNEDFLLKCIETSPKAFKHMSEQARNNPRLVKAAIALDSSLKKYVGNHIALELK